MKYADKLLDPRWQKKRLKILERDNWTCQLCQDTETSFHVHHKKYNGNPWDTADEDLVSYCQDCHLIVENLKNNDVIYKPIKVVKFDSIRKDDPLLVVILDRDDGSQTYSMVFYDLKPDKTLDFRLAITPPVIRELNKELNLLKELING